MSVHTDESMRCLFATLDLAGVGLEVAPFFEPTIDKANHQILYTDYVGTAELQEKIDKGADPQRRRAALIDFVWSSGRSLRECAPAGQWFDYVIASHVFEHVPNPVGWLNELLSVMKIGAKIALFIPDRRKTLDYFRHETDHAALLSWWLERPRVPTTAQVADFMLNAFEEAYGGTVDRAGGVPRETRSSYPDREVVDMATFVYNEGQYVDVHCTVWTADGCKRALERVTSMGLLNVAVSAPLEGYSEFLIFLTKLGEPARMPPAQRVSTTEPFEAFKQSVEHQLGVIRHDLSFSIQMMDQLLKSRQRTAWKPSRILRFIMTQLGGK
jgi:hypothetical protein